MLQVDATIMRIDGHSCPGVIGVSEILEIVDTRSLFLGYELELFGRVWLVLCDGVAFGLVEPSF